jgi:thiosulfate dehydrogenase [quinone] large subunit
LKPADSLTASQQIVLVLFRFSIGWHLFYQGWGKIEAAHWSSESYLRAATGPLAGVFEYMANQTAWLRLADQGTMWGLLILGLLLMVGLFTRIASILAIGLLLLFYAAMPPLPFHGFALRTPDGTELYVNKVLIEILALLVSLVFDTGKISGLDMLVGRWFRRVRPGVNGRAAPADLI